MAITKAAKKAIRQSQRRKASNLQKVKKLKNLLKEVMKFIAEKKTAEAKKLLPEVYQSLDKAAKTGLIKKNTASRKKSRIAKVLQLSKK